MNQKLEALQDLRGIAVLLVVLFHVGGIFGYSQLFKHGGLGVSLFFIISGFVITYVHAKDKGINKAIVFAKKRVARIYAPYILPFLAILALFLLTGMGDDYHRDPVNIIKNTLLVQKPSESIHPYAWSLVYEIFYYLSFGIGVIILRLPVLAYCAILAGPSILYINQQVEADMLLVSSNNLYFVFGVITGYYKIVRFTVPTSIVVLSGLIFLILPYLTDSNIWRLLFVTLFFFCYLQRNTSNKIINQIGTASYSIYLTHALVVPIAKHLLPKSSYYFVIVAMVCLALGFLYHHIFESWTVKQAGKLLNLSNKPNKHPLSTS